MKEPDSLDSLAKMIILIVIQEKPSVTGKD